MVYVYILAFVVLILVAAVIVSAIFIEFSKHNDPAKNLLKESLRGVKSDVKYFIEYPIDNADYKYKILVTIDDKTAISGKILDSNKKQEINQILDLLKTIVNSVEYEY